MSMLTPPGMRGKYRVTGTAYPRMRRPRRRRIVLAVLGSVLALGLLGYGTLQLIDVFRGDAGKRTAAGSKAGCTPAAKGRPAAAKPPVKVLPEPGQITVNVYNATPRSGLAKSVGDELKKRGFRVGKVGNAPADFDKKVAGTGILLGSPKTDRALYSVLGTQLPGAAQQTDARETADVDLILGTAFKQLSTKEDADRALAAMARPAPAPSPKC
ncbi:LytR C-terminal domain-containing protein [Streptomyces bambusae]|uniref:LytR C-terminal domain-containing protein n=1 Tax=Streptomyces bambusae TaxID=1550616 RepID=UPI001CFCCD34|nr:LytR C-terminal domain-containing protein [Streptomyces bambusae]MCB5168891.1 LytR C-terminal domain-containing protein [Streptomyces bambusae]